MEQKAIANREVNEVIFAAIRDTGFEPDFRNAISDIQAPVLVIWGKQDRVINYRNADSFVAAIPERAQGHSGRHRPRADGGSAGESADCFATSLPTTSPR